MKLFARVRAKKPAAPPPAGSAPAKRSRKGLTCAALEGAIAAVCAEMADCSARRTLETLYAVSNDTAGDGIVRLDGPGPVSITLLDDAIAEAQKFELPAGTLSPLTRYRTLLAQAEAKEPVQYVTVAQFKAFEAAVFDTIGWLGGFVAAELNRGQPSQAHLQNMLARSANTPGRRKALDAFGAFDESKVPQRTQAEWLRYQSSGHW